MVTTTISPREFLSGTSRLDLAVKHRFFRWLDGANDPRAEWLYRWHIEQRTGGREARSWKTTIEDYVTAARDLLQAMSARGFDSAFPIHIGSNGALMDGAHRVACAVMLDEPIVIKQIAKFGRAAPWDYQWFAERGLSTADCMQLVRHLHRMKNGPPFESLRLCEAGLRAPG